MAKPFDPREYAVWWDLRVHLTTEGRIRGTGFYKAHVAGGNRIMTDYDALADVLVPFVLRVVREVDHDSTEDGYRKGVTEALERVRAVLGDGNAGEVYDIERDLIGEPEVPYEDPPPEENFWDDRTTPLRDG